MDPKQLVENVRKYWDEEPSLVNNSSVLQDPAPPGKQSITYKLPSVKKYTMTIQ